MLPEGRNISASDALEGLIPEALITEVTPAVSRKGEREKRRRGETKRTMRQHGVCFVFAGQEVGDGNR